jgi:hypothetical protein
VSERLAFLIGLTEIVELYIRHSGSIIVWDCNDDWLRLVGFGMVLRYLVLLALCLCLFAVCSAPSFACFCGREGCR